MDFGGFCKKKVGTENTVIQGKLLYHIPNQMKLNEVLRCVVRISVNEQIIQRGLENLKTQDRTIIISEVMKVLLLEVATLSGKHFEIEAVTENKQFVRIKDIQNYTEWLFNVKPLKKGMHKLALKVYIVERVNNEEVNQQLTFEEVVEVSTKKNKIISQLTELLSSAVFLFRVNGNDNVVIQNSRNVTVDSIIGNISGNFQIGDKLRTSNDIYNIGKVDQSANFDSKVESITLKLFGILSVHIKMSSKSNDKYSIDLTKDLNKEYSTLHFSQNNFVREFSEIKNNLPINNLQPVFKTLLGLCYEMQKQSADSITFGDLEVNILIILYILGSNVKVKNIYEEYIELFKNQVPTKIDIVNSLQILADYGLITQNDSGEIVLIETVAISKYE